MPRIKKINYAGSHLAAEVKKEPEKKMKYFEAVGRRKTAIAQARIFNQGEKEIKVNNKPYKIYFPTVELQKIIESPFYKLNRQAQFRVNLLVKKGGIHAQAEAARLAIAKALCLLNPNFKKLLSKEGYLTRDSRMRERKKFGLKRARRAPQWSKR